MTQITVQSEVREARAKQTAEVFTPHKLVRQMLNKLPKEVWRKGKTFCDPAIGNGQFAIWILIRKIALGHDPLEALQSIYGADIMRDNIRECRHRLLKVIALFEGTESITEEHIRTVFKNIVWINRVAHPLGSLEYDFEFKNRPKQADVDQWMKDIHENDILDDIKLPVDEEQFTPTNNKYGGLDDCFEELQ